MSAQVLEFTPRAKCASSGKSRARIAAEPHYSQQTMAVQAIADDASLRTALERADTRVQRWLLLAVGGLHACHEPY